MKRILLTLLLGTSFGALAQNVNVPDANFKSYLVGNSAINTNGDAEIQVSEAQAYAGQILCTNQNIADLTGIEEFTSVTLLLANNNQVTTLDLSQNIGLEIALIEENQLTNIILPQGPTLERVSVENNELTSIDVTQNPSLEALDVENNQITSIDLSQNAQLLEFRCNINQLTSLDVSQNPNLETLTCNANDLTTLDVSQNLSLEFVSCQLNQITSVDLGNNTNLVRFDCELNPITSVDVSQNTGLQYFLSRYTQLNSLDLSSNAMLVYVDVISNPMTSLTIANGNNTAITYFNTLQNPNLTCIEVDDPAYSSANWSAVQSQVMFSTSCGPLLVSSIDVQGQGGESTITTQGGTLQMEATVLPANADDGTYSWSVANGTGSATIDGAGVLTATGDGTVTVTATANDASGVTGDAVITISNQGSANVDENIISNVSIYPNPASDVLTIKTDGVIEEITVVNMLGKEVVLGMNGTTLDVSNLPNGVYFIELLIDGTHMKRRFIKK